MPPRLRVAVLVIGAIAGSLLVAPATSAEASRSRTVVTPSAPLVGETVTITGRDSRGSKRSIHLQAWNGKRWVKVASTKATKSGRWTFARRAMKGERLRVIAPKKKSFKKVYISVTPRADSATIAVGPGAVVVTHATPRAGRGLVIESRSLGGIWSQDSRAAQSSSVTTRVTLTTPRELREYRARLDSFGTVPSVTTTARSFIDLTPAAPVRLDVETQDGAPIDSKEVYVTGALTIDGERHSMKIRGRGNSTWQAPKKPYRIKLDDKAGLLGMPADKDWALLANYYDRSLLRNQLALTFGSLGDLTWTPKTRYVDLFLNEVYQGSYLLTEHVKASSQRAQVAAGGALLEIDQRAPEDPYLTTSRGTALMFKEPGDPSADLITQIATEAEELETLLGVGDREAVPDPAWRSRVDLDAAADWYLTQELFKNIDSGRFGLSVFMTWRPGQFTLGPLWDFDLTIGVERNDIQNPGATGWWVRDNPDEPRATWIGQMLKDPVFAEQVAQRWRELSPVAHSMAAQARSIGSHLGPSALDDFAAWGGIDRGWYWNGTRHGATYADETAFVATWLEQRASWMDAELD